MADYETIMKALRNADAAGDTAAATRLAQMAREARQSKPEPVPEATPTQPERGLRQRLYDNIIGDPDDGVQSTGEALGTWLNRAGESMTLGVVGDEASAMATGALPGRTYDSELERFRQNEENMSGLGRFSADIAGAIVPGLGAVGAIGKAGTTGARIKRGLQIGAAGGATAGFAEGEGGFGDRAWNALAGTALGGTIGAAIPAVGAGLGRAWRGANEFATSRARSAAVGKDLGVGRRAAGLLSDIVDIDDPQRMRNALAGREGAMLADAGPTAQGALDAVIQSPGEGARTALSRIDDRAAQSGQRLRGALDQTLTGSNVPGQSSRKFSDTSRLQGDIRRATAPARKAVYDRAYAQPIDYSSPQGAALLDDVMPRLPRNVVAEANELMRLNGERSPQIMASIADDGSVTFTRPPDVRQWDYIKQALDSLAEKADGTGAMAGQTRMGTAYQGLARQIRRNLGEAVPEYDYAVNTAGDIIGQVKAIKTGEQLLSARVTRAEAEAALEGMSQAERAAVKRGLRQNIEDTLANVRAVATDPNVDVREVYKAYTSLSSRASRDKMKMLLGEDWPILESALDDASQALGLRARVATNSRTFGRQQFGEMLDDSIEPGAIRSGEVVGTAKSIWQRGTGATPAQVQRAKASVRNELADVLTRPDAQQVMNALATAARIVPNANAGFLPEVITNAAGFTGNALANRQ